MKYCKLCLQPDTRPGIIFHDDGVCAACHFQQDRGDIDWNKRFAEIKKIAQWAKKQSKTFDCVVGVSGGRDSTLQALYARDVLGLKVLLANGAPDGITPWGRANLENLIQMGFDMVSIRPNPIINRLTMKDAFFRYGNINKAPEYYLWSSGYRIAINFNVPLVLQGENAAITLGIAGMEPTGDALQIFKHNTVAEDISIWESKGSDGVSVRDLYLWKPPTREEIESSKIKAVFLNYYAKEWSWSGNTAFSIGRGLIGRENHKPSDAGYLSPYVQIDGEWLFPVNNHLKYLKFGFGGVTDEICYDLREGRTTQKEVFYNLNGEVLNRKKGIQLIEQYDGKVSQVFIKKFCDYVGITNEEFKNHVDKHIVNKHLFRMDTATGEWVPKFKVGVGLNE
jgi:N-acetyl sugar amidotransferase